MNDLDEEKEFTLPILILREIKPLLVHKGVTYANLLSCETADGRILNIYENNALCLTAFIGQQMECLLEITQGDIYYPYVENQPEDVIPFMPLGQTPSYRFFGQLMSLINKPIVDDVTWDNELQKEYENLATTLFKEWGFNGLGIGIDDNKFVIYNDLGVYLLNEYQFEDSIDYMQYKQEITIAIDEIYLRGIRPYIPPEERPLELTDAQKAEQARRQALHQKRLKAYEEMQERIRIRRERGEGPSLV